MRSVNFLLTNRLLIFCKLSVNSLLILSVFPTKWSVNGLLIAKNEVHTELPRMGRIRTFAQETEIPRGDCPLIVKISCVKVEKGPKGQTLVRVHVT